MPDQMVQTGIPMIDVFNSLVESQKLPIFSVAGEPYNELLARIGLQADADIIILGGMGLRHDDYLKFRQTFEEGGVLGRAIMFIHTAADPVVECLLVPDLCLAVGEQYALQGKRVLVLLTDMTAFADALKEIAIIMEQIPSNRGYPGDLYTQLAKRYEKAVDFDGAGSMTVLACVTMPGDDVTHPVPDNTGYITEGQFYLRNGRIEPFGSLSRLKQQVNGKTRDDHRAIMDACIQLYALVPREPRETRHGIRDVRLGPETVEVRLDVRGADHGPVVEYPAVRGAGPLLEDPGRVFRAGGDGDSAGDRRETLAKFTLLDRWRKKSNSRGPN